MYPSDDEVACVEGLISQEEKAEKAFQEASFELYFTPAWRVFRRMRLHRAAVEALDVAAAARQAVWQLTQDWECTEDG